MDKPGPRSLPLRIIPYLLSTVLLLACSSPQPPVLQQATLLPSGRQLDAFSLIDQQGQPFTQDNLKGHWTFAFFGYTHCPDVCPTALAMLAQVIHKLKDKGRGGELPRVLFVSVDPQRDTPQVLAKYLTTFNPDFIGATGEDGEISKLTHQLGIMYAREKGGSDDNYVVNHSAAIVLFDPDGKYHALFGSPHDPDKITSDFLLIRQFYEVTGKKF